MRREPSEYATPSAPPLDGVARRVLSMLSKDLGAHYPDTPDGVLVRFLEQLQSAMQQPGPDAVSSVLNVMRRSGIRDADIADHYIPVIARRLGEGWVSDDLDFAAVSVGAARLQSMLRDLDASWCSPEVAPFGMRGEYCVIVPEGVQHSLGARILAGQLRRAGCDVHLNVDLPLAMIPDTVRSTDLSGVMISASLSESLDLLGDVVRTIRLGNAWVPVLIGGNVLERGSDLGELIGADYAAHDWQSALAFCEQSVLR